MSSHKDFHGGRTYSADPLGQGHGSLAWIRARLAGLFGGHSLDAPTTPPDARPGDAQARLARMFQVIEGPGHHPASFGLTALPRRTELQDN